MSGQLHRIARDEMQAHLDRTRDGLARIRQQLEAAERRSPPAGGSHAASRAASTLMMAAIGFSEARDCYEERLRAFDCQESLVQRSWATLDESRRLLKAVATTFDETGHLRPRDRTPCDPTE